MQYPIVSKIDFDLGTVAEVQNPNNINNFGYWLKHECLCVFGDNLADAFPLFSPSKAIAQAINGPYLAIFADYKQCLFQYQENGLLDPKLRQEVIKKVIRASNIIRTEQDTAWLEGLEDYIRRLHNIDPILMQLLRDIQQDQQNITLPKLDALLNKIQQALDIIAKHGNQSAV